MEDLGKPADEQQFDRYASLYYALGLAGLIFIKALTENNYFFYGFRMGRQVNAALTTAVYRKSLRLTPAARQESTVGEIVNLMQLDAKKIGQEYVPIMNNLWDGLYQIIGYTTAAFYYLGPAAGVGLIVLISIMPLQLFFMRKFFMLRMMMVKSTDSRVKLVNEILQGIRVIKSYNWEKSFADTIESSRDKEMVKLRKLANISSINGAFMMAAPGNSKK